MYQSGTWLLSTLWTVVCSQDILAVVWLCPQINTSRNSHRLLCTNVAYGCYQYFGLYYVHKMFWPSAGYSLAIGWLLAGYVAKSTHFKTYSTNLKWITPSICILAREYTAICVLFSTNFIFFFQKISSNITILQMQRYSW